MLSQNAEQHKSIGREKAHSSYSYSLRADGGKPLFGWFNLTDDEKKTLKTVLQGVFHKDIEIDMEGLGTMLEGFIEIKKHRDNG